jgi:hypothetical protein
VFIVKNLATGTEQFDSLENAKKYFEQNPNTTQITEKDEKQNERILKSRTHKEVGIIEINNKCVYLKVPFYQPSDMPEIQISKIGETPDKLRSKMDVINEIWF